MPLKSGGAVENQNLRGRSNSGLISMGKILANLYAGLNLSPARIVKMQLSFRKVATLTLESGENLSHYGALLIVGDYLYVATRGSVVKVDLSTFTRVSSLTMPTGYYVALATSGGYLYAASYYGLGRVTKINLSDFSIVSTLALIAPAGSSSVTHAVISGNYLYVTHLGTPAVITKIALSTFTVDSTLTLPTGDNDASYGLVKNGYLYVACHYVVLTPPFPWRPRIIKVNLSTFTKDSDLTLPIDDYDAGCLEQDGTYLYAGLGWTLGVPAKIEKIDLATFTSAGTLTLASDENYVWEIRIVGKNLYVGLNTSPGKVVKIDLDTFTKVETLTFDTGENSVYALTS